MLERDRSGMEDIASLVIGSEKLTGIFGRWPSFHDAEVLELRLERGQARPDDSVYESAKITAKIYVFNTTGEVSPEGYFVVVNQTLATLQFRDVTGFEMRWFNQQNVLSELLISTEAGDEGNLSYLSVVLGSSFGMDASFRCLAIEVLAAVPCGPDGKAC